MTNPWTSSNTAVATVSSVGVVTGISVGSTVITYTDSNGCTDTKTVTISTQPVISGTFSACSNGATQLSATTLPNGTNPWLSSDTTVATVNNTGLVSGVAAGTTIITYTNSNGCQDTKTITINALPIISGTPSVCLGLSTQLTGTPTPATLNPWISSNTTIATVNNTGLVNGVATGTATITYTDANGCQDTEIITVNTLPVISGIPSACVNQTTILTATNAPATSLPWTSSNTAIATITNSGIVSGVSSGSAIITYTDANGCQDTQVVTINILPIISGVTSTCANGTTQLLATTLPATVNAWISSNTTIATVSNTGLVTALAAGTTTITYTNINGCVDTEIVTINPLPIISGTLSVCIANTTQLLASTAPALSNPWVSSNTALATISNTGLVTGVATGTVTITYTNSNGCIDTELVIIKTQPAATITLLSASPICSGTTAPSVSISGTANATVTYSVNGTNATIIIPASGSVALPTTSLTTSTTYLLINVTDACTKLLSQSVNVVVTPAPSATISYLKTSFCKSEGLQNVTQTGTSSGTYSVNIIGLSINTTTGAITPTTSAIGNYIVTYTVAPFGGCPLYTTQVSVEIKAGPSATINYGNSYFCKSAPATAIVTQTGSSGGTYSALPTGLIINASTGEITPSSSNPNTYTVKYTIAAAGGCSEYSTTATVIIENVPQFVLPQNGFVCVDPQTNLVTNTYTLNTGLSSPTYTFQWYTVSPTGVQSDIAGATLSTYEVNTYVLNQLYGVLVTNTKGCFRKENAPIIKSSPPNTITAITSTYFADIQTITVNASPNGDYEYQIDNGNYQDSNVFQNVAPGNHVVEVRDRKQCGVLAIDVFIIDYPHFFTPNGDGFNDTWNISSLNNQTNAKINIFDRLGKLIKQIVPSGNGWNGTFNGADLPATDYWFTIQYSEDNINKEFKSHFSLKR